MIDILKRQWYIDSQDKGACCPVCERFGKTYARKLNATFAKYLLWMYQQDLRDPGGWIDMPARAPRWIMRAKNFSLLRHWELVEADEHGGWRITKAGVAFAKNESGERIYKFLYNNKPITFDGMNEQTHDIKEALKSGGFDYDETMASVLSL